MDILLLGNYLERPYLTQAKFTNTGLSVSVGSDRFYNSPTEMADRIQSYAQKSPFVGEYLEPVMHFAP